MELTPAEQEFINLCRKLGWGTIKEVVVQEGQPAGCKLVEQNFRFGKFGGKKGPAT